MAHKMGLVVLDMTTGKTVTETRTMTYDTNERTTDATCSISNSASTTTIYPCHEFNTSSGYTGTLLNASTSGKDCYYIVKCTPTVASVNIKVGCVSTERTEYWDDENVGAGLYSGKCVSRQINSKRTFANLVALFSCVKTVQTITLPWYGAYKIECWGAQGGDLNGFTGGRGGYSSANFVLEGTYYVHVGLSGATSETPLNEPNYNGGGKSGEHEKYGMAGGGATDVRTSPGNWQNTASLKTRFIVAGGGGGANNRGGGYNSGNGGYGGGLTGGTGTTVPSPPATSTTQYYDILSGGTQISGGTTNSYQADGTFIRLYTGSGGKFGYAMAIPPTNPDGIENYHHTQSAGGGGWYGGAGGHHGGGGGGSSFISGHTGCVGIAETPLTCTEGSSVMIDGGGCQWISTTRGSAKLMPNPSGGYYTSGTGHSGNGYAKITSQ